MDKEQLDFLRSLKTGDEVFCPDEIVEYKYKPVIFQELTESLHNGYQVKILENGKIKVLRGWIVSKLCPKEEYANWLSEKIEHCDEQIKIFNSRKSHIDSLLKEL